VAEAPRNANPNENYSGDFFSEKGHLKNENAIFIYLFIYLFIFKS